MTLLIACFLIYQFNFSLWWYPVAVIVWLMRLAVMQSALADIQRR